MIAIFVLLGLALLGGGAAAIYDGMPYLVLERGFTQVIIGAIAATAGVIMLALARVLVEVRRVKATLANATMALSVASMSGAAPQAAAPAVQASVPGEAAQATAGGIAAAGAAIAAASAFEAAPSQDEALREAGREPAADSAEASPDLFGEPASGSEEREAASGSPSVDVETLPAFDPFRPVDPQGEPAAAPALAGDESEIAEEAAGAATAEAADESVSPVIAAEEAPIRPELDVPPSEPEVERERADVRSGADEFSVLRESLAGRLRELDLAETRIEPPLASAAGPEPDPLDTAEAWMDPASSRREPWFDEPAVAEPPPSTPADDLPPWPPQTREARAVAGEPEEPEEPAGGDEGQDAEGPQAAPDEAPEPGAAEASQKPPVAEPAASEEGVVGAYQVGNAHFTIYADGSIQARTPDGDYSFASMDELKVYLASEKNRLGV